MHSGQASDLCSIVAFGYNCMKTQLVQFCFADTGIVNNSMKRRGAGGGGLRCPGTVA